MKPRPRTLPPAYDLDDIALYHLLKDRVAEAVTATAEAIELSADFRFQIGLVLMLEDIEDIGPSEITRTFTTTVVFGKGAAHDAGGRLLREGGPCR